MSENDCRHFNGLYPRGKPTCAMGRDVHAWFARCNGGDTTGIALRIPCTRWHKDSEKPVFDCPDLDRKTQAEVDAERAAMDAHMDKFFKGLPEINKMRAKMIAKGLSAAKATCPWCGEKDALKLTCAIGFNNHVRAQCDACEMGFVE